MKIYSPVNGKTKKLENVNDPMFAEKMLGDGIVIMPSDTLIVAPLKGIVSAIFPTNHAIGLTGENGLEILLHIGIDTVELDGKGFNALVTLGSQVDIGTPLVSVDFAQVIKAGYENDVIVIVTNLNSDMKITPTNANYTSIGDLLITIE